ncbi:LAMI_0G07162g1_1 [Lachancea mirantina]|uniref:Small ribosomal subunit protein uS11m n=1 Tax=Lachancea mirantina TaxID=1230905 RepID=A0A1G4K9I8_9SACH|nr:LAMI_0G07162g1_1 [Lachancea mirantina]
MISRWVTKSFSTAARKLNESTGISFTDVANKAAAMNPMSNVITPTDVGRDAKSKASRRPNEHTVKYVLNCLFTKNNTHFTYSAVVEDLNFLRNNPEASYNDKFLYYLQLPQKVKFRVSTGNLGFRKAARGEYEAAFQTSARLFQMLQEKRLLDRSIEIVLKDFGKGREAFAAALNGKEGTAVRKNVVRVSDATPLKFGGVRAPRPRRL